MYLSISRGFTIWCCEDFFFTVPLQSLKGSSIMENSMLIFVCLLAGIAMQHIPTFPKNGHVTLNKYVIYLALPAMVLSAIPKVHVTTQLLFPASVAWLGFALSFIFFYLLRKRFQWSDTLTGCLILTAGLGNTSFVGFPVIQALYGEAGLATALVVDQVGTFWVLSTLGIMTAAFFSKGTVSISEVVRNIVSFPPFLALVVAATMNVLGLEFISHGQLLLEKLGATLSPVALVAVGLQIKIQRYSPYWRYVAVGLLFKLGITPLFFVFLYKIVLGAQGEVIDVSILESAMAPMITGAIVASNYGLKPRLSSMMVGIGIPVSLLTLTFWYWIITLI